MDLIRSNNQKNINYSFIIGGKMKTTHLSKLLPEFLTDVQIEAAALPFNLTAANSRGVLWQGAPGSFLLDVPEVARYLVENGRRITIDASPQASDSEVARFLRMSPLAALLYQRGRPVFHAAAAAMPDGDGCVLLAGDSGAGKSTLLMTLLQCGWRLLADDLAVVDLDKSGQLVVCPTFPEIVLRKDSADKLGLSMSDKSKRQVFQFDDRFARNSLPLRAVYWLSVINRDQFEFSVIEGAECFRAMALLTYNSHIADALFDPTEYFRWASIFATTIPIYRLRRLRGQWNNVEMANAVERSSK